MSTLAQQFRTLTQPLGESDEIAWSDADHEELNTMLTGLEAHCHALDACDTLESLIHEAQGVNRHIAEQFAAYGFEDFDFETYPIASFTDAASAVNLDVTLESFDQYKKVLIGGGIAGLLLLLAKFIKWLMGRGGRDETTPSSNADDQSRVSKTADRTFKAIDTHVRDVGRAAKKASREAPPDFLPPPSPLVLMDAQGEGTVAEVFASQPNRNEVTATSVKNGIIASWDHHLYEVFAAVFETVLKAPPARFNLPFLRAIVEHGLYDELGDVVEAMNANLVSIEKEFEAGLEYLKTTDGEEPSAKKLAQSKSYYHYHIVSPLRSESSQYRKNADGFHKARTLHAQYTDLMRQNRQDNFMPLEDYSDTYLKNGSSADPTTVVTEVFQSIRSITNQPIRYKGPPIDKPDRILTRIQDWVNTQNEIHAKRGDVKRLHTAFLNAMQKLVAEIAGVYGKTLLMMDLHSKELSRLDTFIDQMIKAYNSEVVEYIKRVYTRNGFDDPRDYRAESKELLKLLTVQPR